VIHTLADSPAALLGATGVLLLAVLLGRRISVSIGPWHAELRPNGGKSVKDRVDRMDRNMHIIAAHLGIADKLEPLPLSERPVIVSSAAEPNG
jgi:hypothetical protein